MMTKKSLKPKKNQESDDLKDQLKISVKPSFDVYKGLYLFDINFEPKICRTIRAVATPKDLLQLKLNANQMADRIARSQLTRVKSLIKSGCKNIEQELIKLSGKDISDDSKKGIE